MKILTFSSLYPNAVHPNHGVFVETRLRHLLESTRVEARVIAPVPWFPSTDPRFGRYAAFARVPLEENRFGIDVLHPRFLTLPKVGMSAAPFLLAKGALSTVSDMIGRGYDLDVIDAHYFYPDGVAAAILGKKLGKPVVITARGTDINLLPHYALPRKMILWAAKCAAALITVSSALKIVLTQLGVESRKITVLRNGVDTTLFRPANRVAARAQLGLSGKVLLMVGNLVPLKGHDLVVKALAEYPDAHLLIIGKGGEEHNLRLLVRELQIEGRVRFLGAMPQQELPKYYTAADALLLASSREGWPNVLLESMACGTPVVAANVGGISEIVTEPEAGVVMGERSVRGILDAVRKLFYDYPDRYLTQRYAESFSWDDTTRGQLALFERVLKAPAATSSIG